jgi:CMP-2-keto-3-deoxyoctulosonic acid synthetase
MITFLSLTINATGANSLVNVAYIQDIVAHERIPAAAVITMQGDNSAIVRESVQDIAKMLDRSGDCQVVSSST